MLLSTTVRRYLIDSEHSNCLALPESPGGLELVEQRTQPGGAELRLSAELEPMSLCLWTIEKGPGPVTLPKNRH